MRTKKRHGGEGGLGSLCVLFFIVTSICQKSVAQTMKPPLPLSPPLLLLPLQSLSCAKINAIIAPDHHTSNYESCFVSTEITQCKLVTATVEDTCQNAPRHCVPQQKRRLARAFWLPADATEGEWHRSQAAIFEMSLLPQLNSSH